MEGDAATLEATLRSLKRRGSNLLVLTDPSETDICTRLLGVDTMVRRRLLVRTHGTETVSSDATAAEFGLVEVPYDRTRTALVEAPSDVSLPKGESAVEPRASDITYPTVTNASTPAWFSRTESDAHPSAIARHIHGHLIRFEAHDPAPSEIRVCFDSLDTLVDDLSRPLLRRFICVVTARTRAVNAISHYHLSSTVSQDVREDLERLFDGTVETRLTVDGVQQRWTLHRSGLQTNWLPLEGES